MNINGAPLGDVAVLLVGYDIAPNGHKTLTVGKRKPKGKLEIINVFFNEEAEELYKKLSIYKEKNS